ncbi:MAG: cell division protein FtsX [Micrococcales bacterium 73-15]|uniref:FtsK/SpoIIIE domain-containing protein n=1 Tax=Salana multivorans TaxID=120377 RepID=UPI000961B5ED|nr:FtsK/SpoIIIE domain-containing protein [Salana multivorans]OJX97419.1 MAG: cell division protein FtsX [Micrococcales bacterium 73-15]
MWRLSVLPSPESKLAPVDVVVEAAEGSTVADLAAGLGDHLGGRGLLLAPTTQGRAWPADTPLVDAGLRDGDVLEVSSVPADWRHRPGPRRTPRATVRVVAGPDAGRHADITGDTLTIGRAPSSGLRLSDPLVSRTHARILLSETPVVLDVGSAHGTVVGGRTITRSTPVAFGERITLGSTVVVIHDGAGEAGRERGVLRSPRFGDRVVAAELDTPTPPGSPRPTPLSWPMMLMPILMGAAMFGMTRSPVSLVFMAGFPAMMFATWLMQRGRARREFEEETALWREDLRAVLATIETAAATQRVNAVDDEPDLGVVLARAIARDHRLWVRRDDSDDFLAVRAGLGPRAALVTGKAVTTGDRGLRAEVTRLLGERATLADLPVPLELAEIPLASVTGETDDVDAWVRASVLRLAVTHSPTDLQLAAVLGPGRAHVESWLRWLPHAAPRGGGTACVGIGAGEGQALLEELASADGGTAHTLCLVDEQAGIPRRLVEAVAAAAPDRRLHLLWLGSSIETVPAGTGTAVDLGAQPSAAARLLHRDRGGIEELTSVESLGLHDVWRAARALSGYRDEAAVLAAESMLPGQVRLPGLSGDLADPDDVDRLLERWATSTGLRAQLGMGGEGVVTIDLREDGPHGLVAGTTGAGKSELLQSLLCSLATNNPPSRITFLLVDYKGGAAFREVAELPHSVGYITDLTPALVQRCLTSLHAELTSREHLLAQYGAKDLLAMERDHPEAAPPAMLICVDEFAALLAEVPEFVEGMVSIAQRGRSLGMHMILATQRPAGVVTPQIKANTDLRIALRVAAPDDSVDVIDAPDAAHLSRRTPGRAWLRRTGHGTRELVQVAWVGAREELHADGGRVRIGPFTARELAGGRHAGTTTLHPRSDLERIVTTTGSAFARSGRPAPKKPWLPPLAAEVPLACAAPGTVVLGTGALDDVLVDGAGAEARRVDQLPGQLVLGLLDRPAEQSQTPWVVDYARGGHLLVYGASGSGKSEMLRTVAAAATAGSSGRLAVPDCVYVIDAGGGALSVLERMPSVGSVVLEQQTERMMRLIRMLARTIAERNALLAARGASDVDALAALGTPLQRIHLLVDNLPAVLDAFDGGGPVRREHAEHVTTILQEGRRCGVHVTATTPQRTGLTSPVQAAFGQRLVLRMTVPDDYVMLGVPGVVLDGDSPAGRGLVGRDEVQVATVGGAGTPVQAERLDALCAAVGERYTDGAALPVPAMPTLVPQHLVPAPEDDAVCVGVEAEYVGAVTLALREAPLLVLGRARSGRTSTLLGLAQAARRSSRPPARITLIGPRAATQLVVADGVLEPAEVVDEVVAGAEQAGAWAEALPATDGDDWHLVLVDDVHLWEREWERSGPERAAVEALTVALAGRRGLAVVAASDPDDARSRQHIPGLTQALRRARRVAVVAPEMSDGSLAATTIPMHTSEPLTGPGRALLVSGGSTHVVQLIAASARTSVNGSLS